MNSNQKPRVLIFSLAYFPFVGGAEIAVKETTDRLSDRFDFDLITLQFERGHVDHEVMGNVDVYRVRGSKSFFPIRAFFLARRLHREKKYKVSWSIMAAYAGGAALLFKIFNPKIPLLLTLQEGDSEEHILKRIGWFYPLWKLIFKKANHIQAISIYLADFAKRYGAVCPVEVVPNGVDLQKFQMTKSKCQINDKIQISNIKTIITTSRLVYKNGIDILIRAGAILKTLIPNSQFLIQIVGGGPEESNLKKLAQNLGLSNEVIFLGHINPDEVPRYLAQADIFVRPSRSEGLGNSFLEAMAAGLPIVGTSVGGIPDFLKDGETGLFCQIDDPKDLAQKISLLLSDNKLYNQLSQNGLKLVRENYSWDKVAAKINLILDTLCAY